MWQFGNVLLIARYATIHRDFVFIAETMAIPTENAKDPRLEQSDTFS